MSNKIKIYGDIDSASIFFLNSTVDPKPLGTIVAELKDDEDRIVVMRTDRLRSDGVSFRVIFKRLNPRRVCNRQGEELVDQLGYTTQQVIDYINEQANLTGVTGGDSNGTDLIGVPCDFKLDATSTSIMVDTGHEFGVNTIKAVAEGGVILIKSELGDLTHFTNIEHNAVFIDGVQVQGGINDIVNALNELFTVGPFQAVVITDPEATIIADVNGVADTGSGVGSNVIDPLGDDVLGTTATHNNAAGYLSAEVIDQAGEYYTFDIKGKATYGFGLVHTQASYDAGHYLGSASYADPAGFCVGANSSHLGYQFAHHFHIGNAHASWTNYGANTSYVLGEAWYDHANRFDAKEAWNNNEAVKVKVGINELGFITISTLQDNGVDWRLHARSAYPVPEGSSFRLGIKLQTTGARLASLPKVHLKEDLAPEMYFRFIESPDGTYQYPLFATEEEANYYDENHTNGVVGSGTSHPHVYVDDPTGTTWYMPDTGSTMSDTEDPSTGFGALDNNFMGQAITWTEITSLNNADLVPPAFPSTTIYVDELTQLNYQVAPMDVDYASSIATSVSGWTLQGNAIVGTAPEVAGDNVSNPSDFTTITVTRTNSYGSSYGVLTVFINNLTAPTVTPIAGVTHEGGTAMVDADTMGDGTAISIDNVINDGNRFTLDKEWLDNYVLPAITSGSGTKSVLIGFPSSSANYSSIEGADFDLAFEFYADDASRAANNWRLKTYRLGAPQANVGIGSLTSGLYDYVLINNGGTLQSGALIASQGHNPSTTVFEYAYQPWYWSLELTGQATASRDIVIATSGTTLDLDLQYFNEYAEPVAAVNATPWTKALDFSGNSERAMQVDNSFYRNALKMANIATTVGSGAAGMTTNDSNARPWATAIVFKADGNNSNQHIWNAGEGTGDNDDNIYLRLDSSRRLWFGWGRSGALNECQVADISGSVSGWHGVYIASNGTRLSGGNATATNLAAAFDIRYTRGNLNWAVGSNKSTSSNWTTTGGRMDRQLTGDFTIGGRGANRNFHGKVASMVVTTLRRGVAMPTDPEIEMMITDPKGWLNNYKVGVAFRLPWQSGNLNSFSLNDGSASYATQVWLMGDGTNDSYSNMIRNQVHPSDQNYTKLNMISMVSNDIQTVSIQGLT